MIRIGTRGSALALAQASWVAERLSGQAELVPITTRGDRRREEADDKSRWVAELEQAVLEDRVDIAVHSAKDVPADLAEGLEVLAIPVRADPRDVLCGAASLEELSPGARVGTSSLRRMAQLRAAREGIDIVPARGNVDTRLRRLSEGEFDAIVLAAAGLERLGRADAAGGVLTELVPAAGQGALLIEGRPGALAAEVVAKLDDAESAACVRAERALVKALGASCHTPVGAYARCVGNTELELTAWVGLPDGSEWIADRLRGTASDLGTAVAARMLAVGAAELLARAGGEVRA
ncbi:MAG TPA: hydroxymethylbilane synthase [Solirubrobacteraceae bacterium]|nr:hydroxymethylbilane synthase [Solirubrobacteraceae bacterium]